MPATYTPLRYPGGKAKLGPFLAELFKANRIVDGAYAEPYAGGAGAGLFLLFRGFANRLHLNDIDRGVVAFWRALLNHNEQFAKTIEKIPLSVREWDRQRTVYKADRSGFDLGFAFFYLNRTNRSGIMNGGIIGGREQEGEWKIDARFNRADLAARARAIGSMRRHISISRADAIDFIDDLAPKAADRLLTNLDPPYYAKGHELYTNYYKADDHAAIAKRVKRLRCKWIITYDDCPEIRALYRGCRILSSELSYSAREVRRGNEIVIIGDGVRMPRPVERIPSRGRAGFELRK